MTESKFRLVEKLFANKEKKRILILGSEYEKYTGQGGPLGYGASKTMRGTAKAPAKYSSIAICLDALVNCKVNALSSSDGEFVYGEYTNDEGKTIRFKTDGKKIEYETERLHQHLAPLPLYLFALRENSALTELKEDFLTAYEHYTTDGCAGIEEVLRTCDTFYYGVAKDQTEEIVVQEDALQMATIREAVSKGNLSPMGILRKVKTPEFTGVKFEKSESVSGYVRVEDYDSVCNGDKVIDYNWSDGQRLRIPDREKTLGQFVPNPAFFSLVSKCSIRLAKVIERMKNGMSALDAMGKDVVNVFMAGKPGTGKTTVAYALGAALGMPVYSIPLTKNTEEDVFQGMNKVVDGALKFVSTDFLDAYTNGGIIILEEINLPDPSVIMGALGQAVEFPYTLMQDGYRPVKRHPLCVIIGTMNIGTFGSKGVNQALSSRFRQTYILDDPTKESFIDILVKATGAKKKDAGWTYSAYDKIISYLKSPAINADDICLNVTLRGCIGALEEMSEGEEPKTAIKNTLVGKISEVDLELANDVFKNVVASLPELY